MIYYDESKRKWVDWVDWVDEQEPSGWSECLVGAVIFALFVVGLFGGSL